MASAKDGFLPFEVKAVKCHVSFQINGKSRDYSFKLHEDSSALKVRRNQNMVSSKVGKGFLESLWSRTISSRSSETSYVIFYEDYF